MKRIFVVECESFPQKDFEMIHRYIRSRLENNNQTLVINSIPIENGETLIFE